MPAVVEDGAVAPETCNSHLVSPTTADATSRLERRRQKAAQQQRKGSAQQRLLQFVQRQILLRFPPPHMKQQPEQTQHQYNTALDGLPEHRDFHRRPPPVVSAEGILARWLVAEPQRLQTLRIFPGLKFDVIQNHRERRTAALCSSASEASSSLGLAGICAPPKHGMSHIFPAVPKSAAISAVEESGHLPSSEEPWWLWPLSNGAPCASKTGNSAPSIKEESDAQAALLASDGRLPLHEPLTGALVAAAADLRRGASESECAVCLQLFNSSTGGFLCNECQQGFDDTHLRSGAKGAYCVDLRQSSIEARPASRARPRRGRPPKQTKTTTSGARQQNLGGKRPAEVPLSTSASEDLTLLCPALHECPAQTDSFEGVGGGVSSNQAICARRKCKRRRGEPRSNRQVRAGGFMAKATTTSANAEALKPLALERDDEPPLQNDAKQTDATHATETGVKTSSSSSNSSLSLSSSASPADSQIEASVQTAASAVKCEERSAAKAAALAAENAWWGTPDPNGFLPTIPPLLLPLLPSIYAFQAHTWPPPPAKRRHASSSANGEPRATPLRRRRGLDCLSVGRNPCASYSLEVCKKQRGLTCSVLGSNTSPQKSGPRVRSSSSTRASSSASASEGSATLSKVSVSPDDDASHHLQTMKSALTPEGMSSSSATSSSVSEDGVSNKVDGSAVCTPDAGDCSVSSEKATALATSVVPASGSSTSETERGGAELKCEETEKAKHEGSVGEDAEAAVAVSGVGIPSSSEKVTAASSPLTLEEGRADSNPKASLTSLSNREGGDSKAGEEDEKCGAASEQKGTFRSTRERTTSLVPSSVLSGPGGSVLARIGQGLLVGRSSLGRESGLGLFACRPFPRRARICEYSGVLIDRGTALLLRSMRCASHVVNVQMQHSYLLGFHTPCPLLGGGAFINDGRWRRDGEGPGVCVRFKVAFDRHRAAQRVLIVATQDIQAGQELLTSYDNDYWRLLALSNPHKRMRCR